MYNCVQFLGGANWWKAFTLVASGSPLLFTDDEVLLVHDVVSSSSEKFGAKCEAVKMGGVPNLDQGRVAPPTGGV